MDTSNRYRPFEQVNGATVNDLMDKADKFRDALQACVDQMEQCERMFRDDVEFLAALNDAREVLSVEPSEPEAPNESGGPGWAGLDTPPVSITFGKEPWLPDSVSEIG